MAPSLADSANTFPLLKEPLLKEEGERETKKKSHRNYYSSPISIYHNGTVRLLRILFHICVVIALNWELQELSKPSLGFFPLVYYSAIGIAVPWEFFWGSSVILVGVLPRFVGPNALYTVLLLLSTFMTMMVGLLKFRQMMNLQKEFVIQQRKNEDNDDDITMDPVQPGPELDALRLAEKKDMRQRKQAQKNAKDENRRNAFAYAGIPSESVAVVV